MPTPRNQQICLSDTPFYHCISRCVRHTFLCGIDSATNKNYSHRKQWITERLALLSKTFAIDVCAYAIMSNHCHTVLKINAPLAQSWSDKEVMQRWAQLFSVPVLVQRYFNGQCQSRAEQSRAIETVKIFRERLMDISWFMRCLNEYIARKANAEDECTGRFWEGRFKSQALLNEQALLACMSYVDLNPVRAKICDSLENSEFTSIKQRIDDLSDPLKNHSVTPPIPLAPFIGSTQTDNGIPFSLKDYLELTDWTGRCVRNDKRGYIKSTTPAILKNLSLDEETWIETVRSFNNQFHFFIGSEQQLQTICKKHKKKWLQGIRICRKLFAEIRPCPA